MKPAAAPAGAMWFRHGDGDRLQLVSACNCGALRGLIANPPNAWSWTLWAYRDIMRGQGGSHGKDPLTVAAVEHTVAIGAAVNRRMAVTPVPDLLEDQCPLSDRPALAH